MKHTWGFATGALLFILGVMGGSSGAVATAGDGTTTNDETLGYLLEGPNQTAEVRINRQKGLVSVKVNPDPGGTTGEQPKHIDITLRPRNMEPITIALGAAEILENRSVIYGGLAPLSSADGSISPLGQSFVGIELRIPLSSEKQDVLQWTDPQERGTNSP